MGVMEGEAAVAAVQATGARAEAMREEYDTQLDARYAAARGFIDAVIYPEDTRAVLTLALRTASHNPGPHLGAFQL
jgi:acetyl-CoA carboxylase carboxyltransferase component